MGKLPRYLVWSLGTPLGLVALGAYVFFLLFWHNRSAVNIDRPLNAPVVKINSVCKAEAVVAGATVMLEHEGLSLRSIEAKLNNGRLATPLSISRMRRVEWHAYHDPSQVTRRYAVSMQFISCKEHEADQQVEKQEAAQSAQTVRTRTLQHKEKNKTPQTKNQRLLGFFVDKIRTQVFNAWDTGFSTSGACTVQMELNQQGQIIGQPRILHSTGNPQFDRAVIAAVEQAAPFSPPIGLSYSLYKDKEITLRLNSSELNHG